MGQESDNILIHSGMVANRLLRKGYTIVQVRPKPNNRQKTIFVFKREPGIEDELLKIALQTYNEAQK